MAEQLTTVSFAESLSRPLYLRVYGFPVTGLVADSIAGTDLSAKGKGGPMFAQINAVAYGPNCFRLPSPMILVVPGPGEPVEIDLCGRKGETVWQVLHSDRTVALERSFGTFDELLEGIGTRGVSGGLRLENPRIENGRACVDVHAWAKIKIFGREVGFDERIPVCVPLQGCHTVWSIGFAKLDICFRAPRQLCGQLCVGKWGIEQCWDYCVDLPIPATSGTASACTCE